MEREENPTSDLSRFGKRELRKAKHLLDAYLDDNETHFLGDGVKIFFNTNSGYVFLSDEDFNTAMLDSDGTLVDFLVSPYEGKEGTFKELVEEYADMHREDQKWLEEIAKSLGEEINRDESDK